MPDLAPITARVTTALAGLLVLGALVAPNELAALTPGAFVRLPVEALVGLAVLPLLPAEARRGAAIACGAVLGVLTVLKIMDIGFSAVLARPFDPVLDWALLDDGVGFLADSAGPAAAIGAVAAAALLAAAVLVVMTLSVRRLTGVAVRHRGAAFRTVAALAPVWVACAVLGAQIVPGVPVATGNASTLLQERAAQVHTSLQDRQAFATAAAEDAFRFTPDEQLLTALRGKDVVLAFVESYGRSSIEQPDLAPQINAVLDAGTQRLTGAGFSARSGFLTSPVAGGSSWLAHATLLSGLWVDNQQRHDALVASDRLTLTSAFRRADWRTVAVMPGTTGEWPEAAFYGHQHVYDFPNLGYRGPDLGWATVPDQYTLSAFERFEHATPDRAPLLAEIALVSSHAPWPLIPRILDWDEVGDGSVFDTMATGEPRDAVWSKGTEHVRAEYRRSVEYSLSSLISWVETYGDDDLVLVVLGDHQPAPVITGPGAGHDVPITVVTRDPAVLDRIAGWGWHDGLRPGPQAPVWPMDAFRDRFLTAFGPQVDPTLPPH